jgi:hypothetical protein
MSDDEVRVDEHPSYSYYFQQLKEGKARFIVQRRMKEAGLDPGKLDTPNELIPVVNPLEQVGESPVVDEPSSTDHIENERATAAQAIIDAKAALSREVEIAQQLTNRSQAERVGMLEPPPPGQVVPPPPTMVGKPATPSGFPVAQPPMPQNANVTPSAVVMGHQPIAVYGGGFALPATSATTALVLSILSLFCGGICLAIPSLMVATGALKVTDSHPGHPDAGSARAAQVISIIVIGLSVVVFLLIMLAGV